MPMQLWLGYIGFLLAVALGVFLYLDIIPIGVKDWCTRHHLF